MLDSQVYLNHNSMDWNGGNKPGSERAGDWGNFLWFTFKGLISTQTQAGPKARKERPRKRVGNNEGKSRTAACCPKSEGGAGSRVQGQLGGHLPEMEPARAQQTSRALQRGRMWEPGCEEIKAKVQLSLGWGSMLHPVQLNFQVNKSKISFQVHWLVDRDCG